MRAQITDKVNKRTMTDFFLEPRSQNRDSPTTLMHTSSNLRVTRRLRQDGNKRILVVIFLSSICLKFDISAHNFRVLNVLISDNKKQILTFT